jgi:hypothetical protein
MKHTLVIAIIFLVSSFFGQAPPQAQKPLGNVELLALWIDGTGSERLAKIVVVRGIDFQPGEDSIHAMAEAGAQEGLLDALHF